MSTEPGEASRSGPARLGSFQVLRELGGGASGSVYLARREGEDRTCALKVLGVTLSSTAHGRFEREARLLTRLDHPGLARCLGSEVDETRNWPFLVLEYVHGVPLEELAAQGPMDPAQAAALVADLADAVGYAHGHGVIHRDIKPANVVVREADGRPVLVDFGLARDLFATGDPALTADGDLVGTPEYMAPEQVRGDPVDALTDVYALGAVLYRLLTGRPPFQSEDLLTLCRQVSEGGPPAPRRLVRAIPPALEEICLQALAVNPTERFPSAHALARALRSVGSRSGSRSPIPRRQLLALLALALLALPGGWLAARFLSSDRRPPAPQPTASPSPGETRIAAEDAEEKERTLRRRLEQAPDQLQPYLDLASFRLERGDLAGAQRVLDRAGAFGVDGPGVDALREQLKAAGAQEQDLIARIQRLRERFQADVALDLARSELKARPESSALMVEAAHTDLVCGGFREALEQFQDAYLLDPGLRESTEVRSLYEAAVAGAPHQNIAPDDNPLWKDWVPFAGGIWEPGPKGWVLGTQEGLGPFSLAGVISRSAPPASNYRVSLELELLPQPERCYAGIIFAAQSFSDFYLVYVFRDAQVLAVSQGEEELQKYRRHFHHDPTLIRVARIANGQWLHVDTLHVGFSPDHPVRLALKVTGDSVEASVEGKALRSWRLERDLAGRVGVLKFYDGQIRFRDFRVE